MLSLPARFFIKKAHQKKAGASMAKKEKYLPINAFYLTCLRDKRSWGREYPETRIWHKRTGELKRIIKKDRMDTLDMIIYVMLLSRADATTYKCFPSIDQISEDCMGIDRHTIIDHLQDLEHMRYISTEKKRGLSTVYYMLDFAEWVKSPYY